MAKTVAMSHGGPPAPAAPHKKALKIAIDPEGSRHPKWLRGFRARQYPQSNRLFWRRQFPCVKKPIVLACELGGYVRPKERQMSWTTPIVIEECLGMEVTSYASAAV
ncbi:MAG: pyrroloquinoline quinone precursor peptide PqqA [Roseiarcus sp.]|jgi:coenzyme PQQ precursor peptide PqqA